VEATVVTAEVTVAEETVEAVNVVVCIPNQSKASMIASIPHVGSLYVRSLYVRSLDMHLSFANSIMTLFFNRFT
jgi:hypothetical protein